MLREGYTVVRPESADLPPTIGVPHGLTVLRKQCRIHRPAGSATPDHPAMRGVNGGQSPIGLGQNDQ
ncbi:MAG: hypothetical protein CME13_05510 [Gemmatimonadetes bacterium]|nr:hypothetical protein [Gemmatimonadota bacterium]HCV23690.1 hypothetical protein [Candidatus Latescibacterota bacterium]